MSCTHGYSGLTTSWFGIARVMSQETESMRTAKICQHLIVSIHQQAIDLFLKMILQNFCLDRFPYIWDNQKGFKVSIMINATASGQ